MESKHWAFLAIVLLSLGWLGFSYIEIDGTDTEHREILHDVANSDALQEIEVRLSSRLDSVKHDLETTLDRVQSSIDAISANIEHEDKPNDPIAEKQVDDTGDLGSQDVAISMASPAEMNFAEYEGDFRYDGCKKQESVFFLKTSKTGSTTIANILTRFGYAHSKTFLLGEQANGGIWFINSYLPFSENVCFLGRDIPNRPRIDISACHIRYNKTAIDTVLQPYNRKISILRNPQDNFISSWKYYHGLIIDLRRRLKSFNEEKPDWIAEISEFLEDPWEHLKHFDYSNSVFLFLVNPQFVFFGEPTYLLRDDHIRSRNLVEAYIGDISRDFALVMVLEDLDTSLALLVLKFCWEVKDVVHLKLNTMQKEKKGLSKTDEDRLKAFLWADVRLYEFFKRKLSKQILHFGKEKVEKIKAEIIAESNRLSAECLVLGDTKNNGGWIQSVKTKPEKSFNQTCYMLTQQEQIVSHLAIEQMIRWKKQYPEWRGPQTPQSPGNDNPSFCYNPTYAKAYKLALGRTEKQQGWGFWDFVRIKTSKYDIKQTVTPEIQQILNTYKANTKIFRENNFIFNDPSKPKAPKIELDPSLVKS